MWNPLSTRKKSKDCRSLRDTLENAQREALRKYRHCRVRNKNILAACSECQQVADDILMTRTMLRAVPRHSEVSAPWFAPRVMAAIAAKESSCANRWRLGPLCRASRAVDLGFRAGAAAGQHLAVQIAASGT